MTMALLPTHRSPTHPGEILALDFLEAHGITQVELAERLGVPFQRINQIVNRRRAVTPDTALRLAQLFGTSAELWLNLQQSWDLYHAVHSPAAREIRRIRPLQRRRVRGRT
jgi:antitoxin HigA-1